MKKIKLTQGKYALVDDEDYDFLNQWKWCAHYQPTRNSGKYNAVRSAVVDGKNITILMHRLIMDAPAGVIIDHKDRNPLNNQRHNLRFANHSLNGANMGLKRNNKSGYRGVYWSEERKKYQAQIQVNQKMKNLGRYLSIKEAAMAYNRAAKEAFGEFAILNVIRKRG